MTLWYLARAAGLTALVAATITLVLGMLASGGASTNGDRLDQRVLRQLAHRSAAVVTLAMLALHVVLLVTDSYVDLSLGGVLVPFTAGYRGFALGLGTLAAYGLLVVSLTGALRGRLAGSARAARAWRAVHLSAYAVWPLSMAHGLLAGTDTSARWTWPLYAACLFAVLVAGWFRLASVEQQHDAPVPTARRHLTSPGSR